jgi:hypothetical protein
MRKAPVSGAFFVAVDVTEPGGHRTALSVMAGLVSSMTPGSALQNRNASFEARHRTKLTDRRGSLIRMRS